MSYARIGGGLESMESGLEGKLFEVLALKTRAAGREGGVGMDVVSRHMDCLRATSALLLYRGTKRRVGAHQGVAFRARRGRNLWARKEKGIFCKGG